MGQVRPRRRFPKVFRFLTSKPGVQRRIGLLTTWRTSEDCVEAKKIKSSSWSSVPDISGHHSDSFDRRSLSAYSVFLGGSLIAWKTEKQTTVSRSSTEAELHAMALVTAKVTWLL
ncbi:hypothetical protein U9M48_003809 [Paspalum notatum var. saurae]|uniref:Mitochondrial protein n=1 Tax=Paspalum notatum var. saurae TaxID=547442 RepID=A0AAQ3SIG9_PASNO